MRFIILPFVFCLVAQVVSSAEEYTVYRLPSDVQLEIDGDLSDWPDVPIMLIGAQQQVVSGKWSGPNDSHAKVRMVWGEQALYMAIEVFDDEIIQKNTRTNAYTLFTNDSIQWAVDINNDGGESYGEGNYEYGFGVADGEPIVYRWFASSGWPKGVAEHVKLAVVPHPDGGVIYEAEVDYSMLAPFRAPEEGHQIGFNLVLQDRDSQDAKSLEWAGGIADGKRPASFGKLNFTKAVGGDADSSFIVSSNDVVGAQGLDIRLIRSGSVATVHEVEYTLISGNGDSILKGKLEPVDADGNEFVTKLPTVDWEVDTYTIEFKDESGTLIASHKVRRSGVEQLDSQIERLKLDMVELKSLIGAANAAGIQARYQMTAYSAARIFLPYIDEDIKLQKYELSIHNVKALLDAVHKSSIDLEAALANPDSVSELMQVPEYDYTDVKIRGSGLVVGDDPVFLMGPLSWLWSIGSSVNDIADIGYNQVKYGWMGQHHFDDRGRLMEPSELPFSVSQNIIKTAHQRNLSVGVSMLTPHQVWKGASRSGKLSLQRFHKIYDAFAKQAISLSGSKDAFDYTVSVETQRAPDAFDPQIHAVLWTDYLRKAHGDIATLNKRYDSNYSGFDEVPFFDGMPLNPAPKYDYVRFRQIIIANELSRAAKTVRSLDPHAVVHGYPYVWALRDPAAYYEHAIDPELDMADMDMVGADSSGPLENERYLMATINWLPSFYDLMRAVAGNRPLNDGEYHFANRRKIYPENWTRAIYLQSYLHGLDSSYAWVWFRGGTIDAALLFDANVLLESGEVSLDIQRLSPEITALQNKPNDLLILYSNASSPHSRNSDGVTYSQMVQSNLAYEGMFFEGLQQGFVTEKQVQEGALDGQKLLIVPNSSHVFEATRDAIEAYAQNGGQVVLIGDSLTFNEYGEPLRPMPSSDNLLSLPAFKNADDARTALIPILQEVNLLSENPVIVDNGKAFPTVEWRLAEVDGRELLYLLNIGYDDARVHLPSGWGRSLDRLSGEYSDESVIDLHPLEVRIQEKL